MQQNQILIALLAIIAAILFALLTVRVLRFWRLRRKTRLLGKALEDAASRFQKLATELSKLDRKMEQVNRIGDHMASGQDSSSMSISAKSRSARRRKRRRVKPLGRRGHIGVVQGWALDAPMAKRLLLYYDHLAVVGFDPWSCSYREDPVFLEDLELLEAEQLIWHFSPPMGDNGALVRREDGERFVPDHEALRHFVLAAEEWPDRSSKEESEDFEQSLDKVTDLHLRAYAQTIRSHLPRSSNVVPIFTSHKALDSCYQTQTREDLIFCPCLEVTYNRLPCIDEGVPWPEIIQFRNDKDTNRKRRALLNWATEAERQGYSLSQASDLLAQKLSEYNATLRLLKRRANMQKAALAVALGGELLESFMKMSLGYGVDLPLSAPAKALFGWKVIDLTLKKGELKAPGREVAYVAHVWEKFGE